MGSPESTVQPYEVFNPLTGEWSPLVSPHRMGRPWQGLLEEGEKDVPPYDNKCYLCPGNMRESKKINPLYTGTWYFTNDFSALIPPNSKSAPRDADPHVLFQRRDDSGECEVLLYSPRHDRTMNSMDVGEIEDVVHLWRGRTYELGKKPYINHVQIFENRGPGASNPHGHAQLWSQENIPVLPAKELKQQQEYFEKNGRPLLIDYVIEELRRKERVVSENADFVTVIPYWAVWPYETMILPKNPRSGLDTLTEDESTTLAESLYVITRAYAEFFQRPKYGAPYTMGVHQRPTDGKEHPEAQFHIHFEPPLLTPDRVKYMVGYERFAQAQRDVTAEKAAALLREVASGIDVRS